MLSRLQYISNGKDLNDHLANIENVLVGGCKWVQLRYKIKEELLDGIAIQKVKDLCRKYQAIFILNDFVDLAKQFDIDGVHLGLSDANVLEARQILGKNKIIGGTANTLNDVKQRIEESCDYIGLGPFRFTTTKENLSPVLGFEGYREIITNSNIPISLYSDIGITKNSKVKIPIYAIGGIELDDIDKIIDLGVYGVAVSGLLTNEQDLKTLIEKINIRTNGSIKNS